MALVYILNSTLAPLGITPRSIAQTSLKLGPDIGLDETGKKFLENVKLKGEYSTSKLKEFYEPFGKKGKELFAIIEDLGSTGKTKVSNKLSQSKKGIKKAFRSISSLDRSETSEQK